TVPEIERRRGQEMAARLSIPVLTRCWQMLLKGLAEVQAAPSPLQAAEMALIRLTHAADMPPPGDLARRLLEPEPSSPSGEPSKPSAPASATRASSLNARSGAAVAETARMQPTLVPKGAP